MPSIVNRPLQSCEHAIANGLLDAQQARIKDHKRHLEDRRMNGQFIGVQQIATPMAPGTKVTERSQVVDSKAQGLQKHYGFDKWVHSQQISKPSPQALHVVDHLLWAKSESTAQRAYTLRARQNDSVALSLDPWQIQIQKVPMVGMIAGKMRKDMQAFDDQLPHMLESVIGQRNTP